MLISDKKIERLASAILNNSLQSKSNSMTEDWVYCIFCNSNSYYDTDGHGEIVHSENCPVLVAKEVLTEIG